MQISLYTIVLYTAVVLLIGFGIGSWITRILLRYPFGANPLTGKDALIGLKGKVADKKNGYLRVAVASQVWNAECEHYESISRGDRVIVKGVDNLTLVVVPVTDTDSIIPGHLKTQA